MKVQFMVKADATKREILTASEPSTMTLITIEDPTDFKDPTHRIPDPYPFIYQATHSGLATLIESEGFRAEALEARCGDQMIISACETLYFRPPVARRIGLS